MKPRIISKAQLIEIRAVYCHAVILAGCSQICLIDILKTAAANHCRKPRQYIHKRKLEELKDRKVFPCKIKDDKKRQKKDSLQLQAKSKCIDRKAGCVTS